MEWDKFLLAPWFWPLAVLVRFIPKPQTHQFPLAMVWHLLFELELMLLMLSSSNSTPQFYIWVRDRGDNNHLFQKQYAEKALS